MEPFTFNHFKRAFGTELRKWFGAIAGLGELLLITYKKGTPSWGKIGCTALIKSFPRAESLKTPERGSL